MSFIEEEVLKADINETIEEFLERNFVIASESSRSFGMLYNS